jgi:hypothetical protein
MLAQELFRLEHPFTLLGSHEYEFRARCPELTFIWPQLGHALNAVRSPGTAQEFQHDRAALQKLLQAHLDSRADRVELISRPKRKARSGVSHFQSVTIACHRNKQ